MAKRLKTVWRSLIHDWPSAPAHKLAAALAKLALVLIPVVVTLLLFPLVVPLGAWMLAVLALGLLVLLLVVNALVRWFPDQPEVAGPQPIPEPPGSEIDLATVLGPYNSQQGLRLYDAAFEGGGVKAIAQIGAVARFHREGMRPRKVVGTSGGAIVGAFLAAGATPEQMWDALARLDLTRFLDPRWLPNQRWLRRAFYGLLPLIPGLVVWKAAVRGRAFERVMQEELLKICGLRDPTFAQLEERYRVELQVVATDITRRRAVILPDAIVDYDGWQGRDPEELSVVQAVRMSMAIPFVFEPVRLRLAGSRVPADIVDGGVSSNYPIWLFDSFDARGPRYPTFGFLLDESLGAHGPPQPVRWLLDYGWNVVQSGIGAIDRILNAHGEARTIRIPTLGVGATDFDLPPERQRALFEAGYRAADDMLRAFVWRDYITAYRGARARIPAQAVGPPGEVDGVVYERE